MQIDKKAFEADAKARATANSSSRYGQQEVCQISGLIINSEETRVRDHKMGRNYRCACLYCAAYAYCCYCYLQNCIDQWEIAVNTACLMRPAVVARTYTALVVQIMVQTA